MSQLFPFFIVLAASLSFSGISRFLHVPWILALIVGGMLLGPSVLDVLRIDPITTFLGDLGLIFLMFMAGLETNIHGFIKLKAPILTISFFNSLVPFLAGCLIALMFGYSLTTSLYVAILFVPTSIAMIVGIFQPTGFLQTKLGRTLTGVCILEDLVALFAVSFILKTTDVASSVPLYIIYPAVVLFIFLARKLLPRLRDIFVSRSETNEMLFENELRLTLSILFGVVIFFSVLGLEPLISSFLSGLILAGSLTNHTLKEKLKTLSYGIFVPAFFIVSGLSINIHSLYSVKGGYYFLAAIVIGFMLSKFISGYLATRMFGYKKNESVLIGVATLPNLATFLAIAFVGREAGIIDETIMSAVVMIVLTTTLIAPVLIRMFLPRVMLSDEAAPVVKALKENGSG